MSTRTARAIAKEHLAQISKGQHPKADQRGVQVGAVETAASKSDAQVDVTLRQAWRRYLEAHLVRKGRSETTIDGYRGHVERIFVEGLDILLRELATDPARVARKHDDVTRENGPYMAHGSMRTLRAIYNHARKTNRSLPPDNPADAIDWNEEKRRDTGTGISDLKGWFLELANLDNPVRREFHLITLLSGSRPAALQEIRPDRIDFRRRTLHISKPKGGKKRAFDIPLSRQMVLCLIRAIRFGREMHPSPTAPVLSRGISFNGLDGPDRLLLLAILEDRAPIDPRASAWLRRFFPRIPKNHGWKLRFRRSQLWFAGDVPQTA
jgi:integrase